VDEQESTERVDAFLRSLGATDEQIGIAHRDGHIAGLAGDLVLAEGASLTAVDMAEQAGLTVDAVLDLWRTLGVVVPDPLRPMFSERDVSFTSYIGGLNPVGEHGGELLRVLGTSLARVAEAAVSVYVQTVQPALDVPEVDLVVWAQELAGAIGAALQLGDSMGVIFIHHMRDAIDRQRVAQTGVSERSLYRLAVGFVDLVGFTPLSLHTAPAELLGMINTFESHAFEVASQHNGRIVKHIGDEVMFVALDAADGCAIARDITAAYAEGIEPRGGVAFGEVITRHGDYYGTVVNLASRLAELAIPREVLVDGATAASAGGTLAFRPAGRRLLKGFEQATDVFSLDLGPVGAPAGSGVGAHQVEDVVHVRPVPGE
jgi:adenylate cyclase